jgi:hypothetical protein
MYGILVSSRNMVAGVGKQVHSKIVLLLIQGSTTTL